jgi:hypothetical protein
MFKSCLAGKMAKKVPFSSEISFVVHRVYCFPEGDGVALRAICIFDFHCAIIRPKARAMLIIG